MAKQVEYREENRAVLKSIQQFDTHGNDVQIVLTVDGSDHLITTSNPNVIAFMASAKDLRLELVVRGTVTDLVPTSSTNHRLTILGDDADDDIVIPEDAPFDDGPSVLSGAHPGIQRIRLPDAPVFHNARGGEPDDDDVADVIVPKDDEEAAHLCRDDLGDLPTISDDEVSTTTHRGQNPTTEHMDAYGYIVTVEPPKSEPDDTKETKPTDPAHSTDVSVDPSVSTPDTSSDTSNVTPSNS